MDDGIIRLIKAKIDMEGNIKDITDPVEVFIDEYEEEVKRIRGIMDRSSCLIERMYVLDEYNGVKGEPCFVNSYMSIKPLMLNNRIHLAELDIRSTHINGDVKTPVTHFIVYFEDSYLLHNNGEAVASLLKSTFIEVFDTYMVEVIESSIKEKGELSLTREAIDTLAIQTFGLSCTSIQQYFKKLMEEKNSSEETK